MPALKNTRHEIFARELVKGRSAIDASEIAGLKRLSQSASRLKNSPKIQARVAELLAERDRIHEGAVKRAIERTSITKEWVIERLVANVNRAMTAEPVMDSNGNQTGEYTYQGAVANKALELLGKELGMFIERHKIDVSTHESALDELDRHANDDVGARALH